MRYKKYVKSWELTHVFMRNFSILQELSVEGWMKKSSTAISRNKLTDLQMQLQLLNSVLKKNY